MEFVFVCFIACFTNLNISAELTIINEIFMKARTYTDAGCVVASYTHACPPQTQHFSSSASFGHHQVYTFVTALCSRCTSSRLCHSGTPQLKSELHSFPLS
jgi:hypothetical protein